MTTQPSNAAPVAAPGRDCAGRLGREPAGRTGHRFAALLNCIDGRAQQPAVDWVRNTLGVTYVDVVTEPGVDAVVARGDEASLDALLEKVCVSRLAHGAEALVIAGHHDCAANPGDAHTHAKDIAAAVERLQAALPEIAVRGLYVDESWTARTAAAATAGT